MSEPERADGTPTPWAGDVLNLGSLALFAWCFYDALGHWNATVDDAFISMRYAWNIAHGDGPVFNVGEPVEGFSNPTWTLLLVIPHLLGNDPIAFGKYVGITCHALTAVVTLRLAWWLANGRGVPAAVTALAGAGLYAVSTPANWWAANAMETPFYALLLVSAAWRWTVERTRDRALPVSALLAGLAGISRPEAPLLVLALAGVVAVDLWKGGARRRLAEWMAALVPFPAAWLIFRLAWYGSLLPNPYYVKGSGSTVDMVLDYLRPWFATETTFLAAGILGLVLLRFVERRRVWLLGGMLLAQVVFLAGMGVDWLVNQRFVVPALPLLAAAAGGGFGAWTERRPFEGARAWAPAAVLVALFGWQASLSVPTNIASLEKGAVTRTPRDRVLDWPPGSLDRTFAGSSSEVLTWALARVPPHASVATSDVGLMGYTTDWTLIDLSGLVDPDMGGKTGLSHEEKVESLHRRAPDWLILRDGPAFHLILTRKAAWLRDEYELEMGPKGLWVARRRSSPRATDAEVVENFTRAVERVPRFIPLQEARIQWTLGVGTPQQREAVCADFEEAFPKITDMRDKCRAAVATGATRPSNAPMPIPADQMAKALSNGLPGAGAAAQSDDPFATPGANGVGKGWMTVPPTLAGTRIRLVEGALQLDGGDPSALACEAEATVLSGPRRVRGQWKVDGLTRPEDAAITVRLLDANDEAVGEPLVIAQPGATTQEWTFIDRAVTPPEGAAQARICVSVGGAGSASVKGLAFTR